MSSQGGIQKKGDTSLKDVSGQARQVFMIRAVATCRRITRQKGVASKKKHLICFLNEPRIFRDKSVWSHRYAETIGVAGRVLILVSLWLIDISVDRFLLHSWIFFTFLFLSHRIRFAQNLFAQFFLKFGHETMDCQSCYSSL